MRNYENNTGCKQPLMLTKNNAYTIWNIIPIFPQTIFKSMHCSALLFQSHSNTANVLSQMWYKSPSISLDCGLWIFEAAIAPVIILKSIGFPCQHHWSAQSCVLTTSGGRRLDCFSIAAYIGDAQRIPPPSASGQITAGLRNAHVCQKQIPPAIDLW